MTDERASEQASQPASELLVKNECEGVSAPVAAGAKVANREKRFSSFSASSANTCSSASVSRKIRDHDARQTHTWCAFFINTRTHSRRYRENARDTELVRARRPIEDAWATERISFLTMDQRTLFAFATAPSVRPLADEIIGRTLSTGERGRSNERKNGPANVQFPPTCAYSSG